MPPFKGFLSTVRYHKKEDPKSGNPLICYSGKVLLEAGDVFGLSGTHLVLKDYS